MLNSRITIRQRASGSDAAGQPVATMVDLVTVWAEIRHPSGLEVLRGDAPVSVVRASIRVRQRTDITAAMQAVHNGIIYDIKAILTDEIDRRFMFLVCEAAK